ncbi:MAG: NAD-dependent epimerase/dehydratase family protein, partial [Candidatus Tectomicrobia bacterium]
MSVEIRGRKIVLIGGAGFIGHNLALALADRGADVEIIDSLQVNNLLWFSSRDADPQHRELYLRIINERLELLRKAGIPLHPQDARDYHALSRILGQIKPQVVIHLAAVSHAGRSNKDPYSTFDHSLRTLENALDYSRGNIEQFIFFSSSMVYGNFLTEAVDEEHPLNAIGIYGALKVAGEKIVIAYQQVFDLPYTIIRPSALYGPRCVSRRVGQV